MSLKHAFSSAKADGTDPTNIQPSNWNADHVFDGNLTTGGASSTNPINFSTNGNIKATLFATTGFGLDTNDFNGTTLGTQFKVNFDAATGNANVTLQSYQNGVTPQGNLVLQPSGGNVGIKRVPEAWNTNHTVLALGYDGAIYSGVAADGVSMVSGVYDNLAGNWTYNTTNGASVFQVSNGLFTWSGAPAATFGSTATLTERMRLDASGRLGLSRVPDAWSNLEVPMQIGNDGAIYAPASGDGMSMVAGAYYNQAGNWINNGGVFPSLYQMNAGQHNWYVGSNSTLGGNVNFTRNMNLDGSGNLSCSSISVSASGINVTGGRCRMTNGGFSATGFGFEATWDFDGSIHTNCGNGVVIQCVSGGVILNNTATSWSAYSDETIKTFTADITDGLTKVVGLRTKIGYYNNDPQKISHPFLVAQDVQAVLPEAVSVREIHPDTIDPEEPTDPLVGKLLLSYTDTIPLLVAAFKDVKSQLDAANEQIASLLTRVAALEAKS